PGDSRARRWYGFVSRYSFWYGAKGAASDELWDQLKRGTLILLYHAFGTDGERASRYVVPSRRFAGQMKLLSRLGYNVLSLNEYLEHRREHRLPPPRSVVITMDDGYRDNETVAGPILDRYGYSATVFLVTSPAKGWSQREPALAERAVLGLDQARRLHGGALRFGAHTRTHPDLTKLDATAAENEIAGSKRELERVLKTTVSAFAYPYGELNDETRRIVKEAGFAGACGVKP